MPSELLSRLDEQLAKRRAFVVDAALQRALAHAQIARDVPDVRTPTRQAALEDRLHLLANRALHLELSKRGDERRRQHVEQLRVMTGEGTIEIGALEHQRIARGAVTDHASEVGTMGVIFGLGRASSTRNGVMCCPVPRRPSSTSEANA